MRDHRAAHVSNVLLRYWDWNAILGSTGYVRMSQIVKPAYSYSGYIAELVPLRVPRRLRVTSVEAFAAKRIAAPCVSCSIRWQKILFR